MTTVESYDVSIGSSCTPRFEELVLDDFSSWIGGFSDVDFLRSCQCGDLLSVVYRQLRVRWLTYVS